MPPTAGLPPFLTAQASGCVLHVRVIPRAGKTGVAGTRAGALLVRLAAAPVEGAANDALIALLAEIISVPRRHVRLLSGERSRDKRIEIEANASAVAVRLAGHLDAIARRVRP